MGGVRAVFWEGSDLFFNLFPAFMWEGPDLFSIYFLHSWEGSDLNGARITHKS
jgi:hypothetical protein